jgi:cytidine deaminase
MPALLSQLALSALLAGALASCGLPRDPAPGPAWVFSDEARALVPDPVMRARMSAALDAAEGAGTDPSISRFNVRAATVVGAGPDERVVVGGNSEWAVPEAIHGETSVINHAIATVGPTVTRDTMGFLAFAGESCGGGGSCGDCRDYIMQTTDYERLLVVCGNTADRIVHVARFADNLVAESTLEERSVNDVPGLEAAEAIRLVAAAIQARRGGVSLFTERALHVGAAALSDRGAIYAAAGADDAAFHYRYAIGGALQQAATAGDYALRAVAVAGAGEPGQIPRVLYRDRQYGYEYSTFRTRRGQPPTIVLLVSDPTTVRVGTFEAMLPGAFSAADFMPEAVDRFLSSVSDVPR